MKLELFTEGKDALLMRIENLGDTFDSNSELQYTSIRHRDLATGLYELVNGVGATCTLHIEEMTISANQNIDTMKANKI